MNMRHYIKILLFGFFSLSFIQADTESLPYSTSACPETTQQKISKSETKPAPRKPGDAKAAVIILLAALYMHDPSLILNTIIRDAVSYTAHELGHAIAAKLLWNNPISIGLGASQPKTEGSVFQSDSFTLESWYPAGGWSKSTKPTKIDPQTGATVLDTQKQAIMLAAGGICGALGHFICNLVEAGYHSKTKGTAMPSLKELCYDYGIAEQLLENVILPNDSYDRYKNDARTLWEECLSVQPPELAGKIQPWAVAALVLHGISKHGIEKKEKEWLIRKAFQILCA